MATINLWDFYPWCKEEIFVEISNEILGAMKSADRQREAYRRRTMKKRNVATIVISRFFEALGRKYPAVAFPLGELAGHFAAKRKVSEWIIYFM